MTRVAFDVSSKTGGIIGFNAKGHTGYADEGSDIVCAGVSALTQTCVNALRELAGIAPSVIVGKGHMSVSVGAELSDPVIQTIMKTMMIGIRAIAEQYPANVSVTERLRHDE